MIAQEQETTVSGSDSVNGIVMLPSVNYVWPVTDVSESFSIIIAGGDTDDDDIIHSDVIEQEVLDHLDEPQAR